MAQFLKIYRDFNESLLAENGDDAVMDSNFSDEQFEKLKEDFINSDSKAVNQEGFWKEELEMLLGNREHYRNEK